MKTAIEKIVKLEKKIISWLENIQTLYILCIDNFK